MKNNKSEMRGSLHSAAPQRTMKLSVAPVEMTRKTSNDNNKSKDNYNSKSKNKGNGKRNNDDDYNYNGKGEGEDDWSVCFM